MQAPALGLLSRSACLLFILKNFLWPSFTESQPSAMWYSPRRQRDWLSSISDLGWAGAESETSRGSTACFPRALLFWPWQCVRGLPEWHLPSDLGWRIAKASYPPPSTLNFCLHLFQLLSDSLQHRKGSMPTAHEPGRPTWAGPHLSHPPFPRFWHRAWHTMGTQQGFAELHWT